MFSPSDLKIEITKCLDNRTLRMRECEAYLWTPVDPASQPDDLREKTLCLTEKRFRIIWHLGHLI